MILTNINGLPYLKMIMFKVKNLLVLCKRVRAPVVMNYIDDLVGSKVAYA